jgi:hypothetical protein
MLSASSRERPPTILVASSKRSTFTVCSACTTALFEAKLSEEAQDIVECVDATAPGSYHRMQAPGTYVIQHRGL